MNLTLINVIGNHCERSNWQTDRRSAAGNVDLSRLLMQALDEIDYGVIMVNQLAQVRYANQVALGECNSNRTIRVSDGIVTMRADSDQRALQKALLAAHRGSRSLLNTSGCSDVPIIAVIPLDLAGGCATLLVFGKQKLCEPLSIDFFARSHHLTPAENTVLRGLCSGMIPDQIAIDNGVAFSTVRTQVSSIRSKTGTRSIRELIGRITSLPPMVSRLHEKGEFALRSIERLAA